jgi:acyl carrier protein
MNVPPSEDLVRVALASHLGVPPEAVSLAHELDRDLGLDALDIVLVALRLENVLEAEIPIADLELAVTVQDFADVIIGARLTMPMPEPRFAPQADLRP